MNKIVISILFGLFIIVSAMAVYVRIFNQESELAIETRDEAQSSVRLLP